MGLMRMCSECEEPGGGIRVVVDDTAPLTDVVAQAMHLSEVLTQRDPCFLYIWGTTAGHTYPKKMLGLAGQVASPGDVLEFDTLLNEWKIVGSLNSATDAIQRWLAQDWKQGQVVYYNYELYKATQDIPYTEGAPQRDTGPWERITTTEAHSLQNFDYTKDYSKGEVVAVHYTSPDDVYKIYFAGADIAAGQLPPGTTGAPADWIPVDGQRILYVDDNAMVQATPGHDGDLLIVTRQDPDDNGRVYRRAWIPVNSPPIVRDEYAHPVDGTVSSGALVIQEVLPPAEMAKLIVGQRFWIVDPRDPLRYREYEVTNDARLAFNNTMTSVGVQAVVDGPHGVPAAPFTGQRLMFDWMPPQAGGGEGWEYIGRLGGDMTVTVSTTLGETPAAASLSPITGDVFVNLQTTTPGFTTERSGSRSRPVSRR